MTAKELELKDIAGYLPYGLKRLEVNPKDKNDSYVSSFYIHNAEFHIKKGDKPILRPLSDLYHTITHNGKEIMPIVELQKIEKETNSDFYMLKDILSRTLGEMPDGNLDFEDGCFILYKKQEKELGLFVIENKLTGELEDCYPEIEHVPNQIPLFDYLNSLFIDYRSLIDAKLAVSCYDLKSNPYK